MKVTQEKLPDSQVGLAIEISSEISKHTYEQVLRKFTQTANIPGFRKGKVPRPVLIQRLGATRLKVAALEELVESAVKQAIKAENIEVIGNYQLNPPFEDLVDQYQPGAQVNFSASVDVPPQVLLGNYKGLTVKVEEAQYDADQTRQTLEKYQQNLATLVPIEDRPAESGDVAVVDFVGKLVEPGQDPVEFEGGSAQEFQVEISEGRFIPGFVEGMIGMELNQTKDVEVTFPADYPHPEMAGKPAIFTITLKDLKEKELPDLDDDFAQEVSEFETLEALKASLEAQNQQEFEATVQANKERALLDELVKYIEVEIPKTLIQREVDFLVNQTVNRFANQGIDMNQFLTKELVEDMRANARPEAVERLKRTLALGEVAKKEAITVEEDAVEEQVKTLMADVEEPGKIDLDRLYQVVHEDLLKEKIITWLMENSTIEMVPAGTLAETQSVATAETVEGNALPAVEAEAAIAPATTADMEAAEAAIAVTDPVSTAETDSSVTDTDA